MTGGFVPGGHISFHFCGPDDLTRSNPPIYSQEVALTGNSASTMPGFTTVASGTCEPTASYSGDANKNVASSICAAEAVNVTGPPND